MTGAPALPSDVGSFAAALAGQYEIEREIGRGGMGIVYLARDVRLDRLVAIKTLPPHLANDPIVRERFLREARTAGALSHQNIVPIHRADEIAGHVFFVMGFVDGESMAQRIRERGGLDPLEVARQLYDVADALSYAHQHGIIHRDIKTENILIDRRTGRAMVTDFGIARLAEATPLTSTGQILGTVYYLSPEQISGDPVDARSDIYSLGVVGFFALSGRFPFDGDLASAVLIAHVTKPPPSLSVAAPHVPHAFAELVDRCLAKDPAARFPGCRTLCASLATIAQQLERERANGATSALAPAVIPAPQLLSDTEAQSIWRRAADLQSLTGIQQRPTPILGQRDAERDAAQTSGYRVDDIRGAASQAGIDSKYVDHALAEHGVVMPNVVTSAPLIAVDSGSDESALSGGRHQLRYEVVIDGELPEDDFDLLVDIIRRQTNQTGLLASVGRSLSWQTHPGGRNMQVSVLPRGGKTTIRVSENLKKAIGEIFGGIMGSIGGAMVPVMIGIGFKLHNPLFAASVYAGSFLITYASSRGIFGYTTRSRDKELRELAEALAKQARESISAARPKLLR